MVTVAQWAAARGPKTIISRWSVPTVKPIWKFNMPGKSHVVIMFKADLAAVGIPYTDESGRVADFHSLRHTTGSLLAASGVHPKVAQTLMRHSKIELTLGRYSHVYAGQETEAIKSLPDLSLPSKQAQRAIATGTDNVSLSSCLALGCEKRTTSDYTGERKNEKGANSQSAAKATIEAQIPHFCGENGEGGIRTRGAGLYPHDGLANRYLKPLGHLS